MANDQINFEIKAGEIHAILGENGAGKTTLMNILFGLLQPEEGEIYIRGERVQFQIASGCNQYGYWDGPPTPETGSRLIRQSRISSLGIRVLD